MFRNFIHYDTARFILAVALTVLCVFVLPLISRAEKGNLENIVAEDPAVQPPLYITLGKAELVEVPGEVADVLVANPSIIDVKAIQANRLYVVGLAVGDTNVMALDASGNMLKKIDIHVKYDLQAIQALINDLYPDEKVTIRSIHDQIILTGNVSTPDNSSKIADVVAHYVGDLQNQKGKTDELISNMLQVQGEQQVTLQVRIIEASRTVLKELGIETNLNDTDELATSTIFGAAPSSVDGTKSLGLVTGAGIALSQEPNAIGRILADTGIAGIGDIGIFLRALEDENLVHVLAEPNLTAVSGEQAGFLAGGEFPVPTGRDQTGNLVLDFRKFGVSLNFKPVVLSKGRISLQLNTEVSSLDFDSAVTLADINVPGLNVRRADTTVEIPSGGSLMIAGLLKSQTVKGMSGLPGISKTPILGDLIKSDQFRREETELVVIVTPYIVKPYAEKDRVQQAPAQEQHENPLAQSFVTNVRKEYEIDDDTLFNGDQKFGYILD